jgi:hypothetical protein
MGCVHVGEQPCLAPPIQVNLLVYLLQIGYGVQTDVKRLSRLRIKMNRDLLFFQLQLAAVYGLLCQHTQAGLVIFVNQTNVYCFILDWRQETCRLKVQISWQMFPRPENQHQSISRLISNEVCTVLAPI